LSKAVRNQIPESGLIDEQYKELRQCEQTDEILTIPKYALNLAHVILLKTHPGKINQVNSLANQIFIHNMEVKENDGRQVVIDIRVMDL
jgi:hypothetical protein